MKPNICINTQYKNQTDIKNMCLWCIRNFGEIWSIRPESRSGRWVVYWEGPQIAHGTAHKWWFREEADAVWFKLKWL